MELLQWIRITYAVIASIVLVLMIVEFKRRVKELDRKQLYWALALLGLTISTVIASLESVYFNDHLSVRTPLFVACTVWCGLALRASRKEKTTIRRGNDET